MPLRFLRWSSLLLATLALPGALLLPLNPARADIQNPGRSSFPGDRNNERQGERPPNAVPQVVGVVEGGVVTVVLRARGHSGEMVAFMIRTPPAHGTFDGDPRQLTLNTAAIVYTPRPGDNAAEDSFTYAVQTRTSPVSAEATVTIRIQEPAPVLAVSPGELDFGAVKVGEATRAEVTLTNQGGGETAGRLDPPVPWVVEGPADYRLPRGASQTFALVFKPQAGRVYTDTMHFRHEAGGGVRLVGTGLGGPAPGGAEAKTRSAAASSQVSAGAGNPAAGSPLPVADATPRPAAFAAVGTPAAAGPSAVGSGPTRLEPNFPGGVPTAPSGGVTIPAETEEGAVTAVELRERGRSTLDLRWRVPAPAPTRYRVEIRYLSLDQDDRLVVDWRSYAQVEFQGMPGYVKAHLHGLEAETQVCLRVVSVDAAGRLSTPSPLLITYTRPAATWWRPTPLKVLWVLLFICGGMVLRNRWETRQVLREIDESRRHRMA